MEQQNQAILKTELSEQITACAFSKADLQALCERLQEWGDKALEEEINYYKPLNRTQEQFRADTASLREEFKIKVTVQGIDDERIYGTIPAVFNSPRFPDQVKSLYINTQQKLKKLYNWYPRNSFALSLDFTKSELFNLLLSPLRSTLSNIRVSGLDAAWVNGVYSEVTNFIKRKKTHRRFLYRHGIYDWLMPLGGFPFAFSIAYKLSGLINNLFDEHSGVLKSAAYVYVFYFSLFLFRLLFDYARWIFPIVEYKGSIGTARKHRAILGVLVLGVLGNLLYDVFKIVTGLIS